MEEQFKNISDSDILELLVERLKYHSDQAEKYKRLIDAYSVENSLAEHYSKKTSYTGETGEKGRRITFEDRVIAFLSDGAPMTTRMLYDKYQKLGLKSLTVKDFSTKLTIRAKSNGNIKNVRLLDHNGKYRHWWGLSEWFYDNGTLKDEFVVKVK